VTIAVYIYEEYNVYVDNSEARLLSAHLYVFSQFILQQTN